MHHPILNVAIQAIRKAGNFIIKQYEFIDQNQSYLSPDYIKVFIAKIEKESKNIITTIIHKFYPTHLININKNFFYNKKINETIWIIESIDSKLNFLTQFPFFTLSIAVQHKEHIEIGVIYDPIHNELFSACRGKGAYCNGHRIRLNRNDHYISNNHLKTVILALSSFCCTTNITAFNILNALNTQKTIVDFRRTGSTILDLAYVAIGRIDGCLILALKKTNELSSAILMIKESGGFITDFDGIGMNHLNLYGNIIIGSSKIIKSIIHFTKKLNTKIS